MSVIAGGPCPYCGAPLDAADDADGDAAPEPGDVGVCLYCARVHVFTERLTLRKPTPEEAEEHATHAQLQRVISVIKTHGPRNPGRRPSGEPQP